MEVQTLAPFEKTVAGSTPFLFAQNFPGRVFKPAHPCEKEFYECIDKHPQLRPLVPRYHGTLTYQPAGNAPSTSSQAAEYLVMEDLTFGFTHPCILDVKLGTTHHDIDFTNPHKHPPRQSKYLTAPDLGFCLTGMQVFKSTPNRYEFMDKSEGRHLTQKTVIDKLFYFFQDGFTVRRDVISKLIQKLVQVANYFQNKPAYTFRSTSLLLLYEGKIGPDCLDRVEVKMIDFAHAKKLPIGDNVEFKDEYGYLYGTKNFIKILENLKTRLDSDIPATITITSTHQLINSPTITAAATTTTHSAEPTTSPSTSRCTSPSTSTSASATATSSAN